MNSNVKLPENHPHRPRYPVINEHPSYDEIRGNFNAGDYTKWFGIGAVSFPIGYMIGAKHVHLRTPTAVTAGFLGTLAGYLMAYQSSSGRLQGYFENGGEVAARMKRIAASEEKVSEE